MGLSEAKASIIFADEDLFVGISPSGHSIALDTDSTRSVGPSPVELLLIALGSCTAVDVIGILKKKRQHVTKYKVEVSGKRSEEYPRKFTSMTVHHVVRGTAINPSAVTQAIELSSSKYCSVAASLRPTVEIHSTFEIIEETFSSDVRE